MGVDLGTYKHLLTAHCCLNGGSWCWDVPSPGVRRYFIVYPIKHIHLHLHPLLRPLGARHLPQVVVLMVVVLAVVVVVVLAVAVVVVVIVVVVVVVVVVVLVMLAQQIAAQ